jgi:hypothetical protein
MVDVDDAIVKRCVELQARVPPTLETIWSPSSLPYMVDHTVFKVNHGPSRPLFYWVGFGRR